MKHTVGIAGLGLIGGSMAKAIRAKTDCRIYGMDILPDVVSQAKAQGVIDGELAGGTLAECSLVIIALYPDDVISYFKKNAALLKNGAIVVDCAGNKTRVCAELSGFAQSRSIRFIGGHPMAGIECSGYSCSGAGLFSGATMILCEDAYTDRAALEEMSSFFLSLGFGNIKITTAREHDEVIAYTSQLVHLVSSAYMHSGTAQKRMGFSAGSFKDLTRVAKLNENMWTALFFENRENLLKETDMFLESVRGYRDALAACDFGRMKDLLASGTALKLADEEREKEWLSGKKNG